MNPLRQLLSYLPVDMCVRISVGRVLAHIGSTTFLVYDAERDGVDGTWSIVPLRLLDDEERQVA
jgi:hypothetical protein